MERVYYSNSAFIEILGPFLNNFKYQVNDEITRFNVKTGIEQKLHEMGVRNFEVVCDERYNLPSTIKEGKLIGKVFLDDHRVIDFIIE